MTLPPEPGSRPYEPYGGPPRTGSYIPPMQYPPGWGPQHYPYAPPPYPQYPYASVGPASERRPAQVTSAGVLGYVVAGFLFLGAMLLFFGASFLTDWDDLSGQAHDSFIVQFVVCGLANLLAGGLLIGGGVSIGARSINGRTGYTLGALIVVVEAIYWMVAWGPRSNGGAFVYAVLFSVPLVIGVWLIWSQPVMRWLDEAASSAHPTASGSSYR